MRESTETALMEKGGTDEVFVKRAVIAADEAPPGGRIKAGLGALVAMAETDPAAARSALHLLRTDHLRLARLEAWLGSNPARATFALGAAIQLAHTELSTKTPNLPSITPDLLHWLEDEW